MEMIIVNLLICIINAGFAFKFLHLFQLKNYSAERYVKYFFSLKGIFVIVNIIALILQIAIKNLTFLLTSNLIILWYNYFSNFLLIKSKKTPLQFTGRAKRLIIIMIILVFLPLPFRYGAIMSNLVLVLSPIIANYLNIYDFIRNKQFIQQAQHKLLDSNAKVIAITGSNGKTSIKNILFEMLKEKYNVLATPKSYNTPLGISKFINETSLQNCHFILLEYGARKKGDILTLCNTFGADYGIISCVVPQHLQSFKNVNNIHKTKAELAQFLNGKPCVFNLDNLHTLQMFQTYKNGISASIFSPANVWVDNIKIENHLSQFTLHLNNSEISCKTKLLGSHNVQNIALAAALAEELNVPALNIKIAIENLNFIPHRLELIKGKMNILDDSYNCSLASAKESIKVLNQFSGKKMIVTPGIIEGGKYQHKINKQLGEMCKSNWVVIVGNTNKNAIIEGLKQQNFEMKNVLFASTLEDAKQYFSLLNFNDTLLLLNDLPDDYTWTNLNISNASEPSE